MLKLNSAKLILLTTFLFVPFANAEKTKEEPPKEAPASDPDAELMKELKPGEIFNCEVDIFIEWEKQTAKLKTVALDPKNPGTPTPSTTESAKKLKQFVETLVERGNDGKLCKSRLESRLTVAKSNALESCKKVHNSSTCRSEKISFAKNDLQILDFQTKRALIASISETCEDQAGECFESTNSEIRCQIYRSPDTIAPKPEPPPAAPGKK